ncbi:hypothetical protein RRG08_007637 [Elysia crispata]|uniref:Uncharacterized protein n=1 Tax=Elysia crispata TaxID=231223 RepID=A0AAE1CRY7_9GAST|nr:hypothetical protein RRG08_007637 [Elysia crispata]
MYQARSSRGETSGDRGKEHPLGESTKTLHCWGKSNDQEYPEGVTYDSPDVLHGHDMSMGQFIYVTRLELIGVSELRHQFETALAFFELDASLCSNSFCNDDKKILTCYIISRLVAIWSLQPQ